MEGTVRGLWAGFNGVIYGYCPCGREVKKTEEGATEECPMCKMRLNWPDFEDQK